MMRVALCFAGLLAGYVVAAVAAGVMAWSER